LALISFPRADLDSRGLPAADDAGYGIHRPGDAFRPGCLLGFGDWRVNCSSGAVHRRPLVDLLLGGPIIAGPHPHSLLCPACICHPGMMLVFAGLHIWMVSGLGITTGPCRGALCAAALTSRSTTSSPKGRHPFRAWGSVERHGLLRCDSLCGGGMRDDPGTLLGRRVFLIHHHSNRTKPDFFFFVDLHHSLVSPREPGDAIHLDCPPSWESASCWRFRFLPVREKELAPQADRGGSRSRSWR